MRQLVECNWVSLNKADEELCGDSVMIRTRADSFVAVLSDGLGSGVKASILSSLTAEIAARMFEADGTVDDVMQTLAETLPECSVRKLAYATFAVLIVYHGRDAHLVLFDSPPLILIRNNAIFDIPVKERQVKDRIIKEAHFELLDNDYMVLISDGYTHAGLGGIYRMGWGWKNVATAVQRFVQTGVDTVKLTEAMSKTCMKLYSDKPGDDATVISMKVRPAVSVCVLTGPPTNKDMDEFAVSRLMAASGDKIICGGSTAQMAARVLNEKLDVEWIPPWKRTGEEPKKKGSPPTATLKGVNLVTEGILTIGQALEIMRSAKTIHDLPKDNDAATRLARYFLAADDIHLIVGTAINPNQVADLIRGEPMRMVYIRELVADLNARNKIITVERV
ncbi:MAG: stage II sporulation protein E [Deltaproteobacteria bacterium HGW-Deltaproteobacteria-6]|nr:MAG: stage II sporulation protein E [Deltaproteobacteria bacterium HGW-Deltaproteobacteria-6]PKN97039.1 MAG: stage II sporulation protein E [Chloroflexi bacterium HGW-Chloroflexi-5]